jgi:hypothetical protein
MSRRLPQLTALAIVALFGAGCSNGSAESGSATTATHGKGMKFAECMRDNGVRAFPDPDSSGDLTIDAVANNSSLDTDTPAFKKALGACRDLEPPGFTGHKRGAKEQQSALEFAQCMRDNGVRDFPDPTPNAPLIDTTRIPSAAGRGARSIPGFTAATQKCTGVYSGALGLKGR